jgi:hypothetical protein
MSSEYVIAFYGGAMIAAYSRERLRYRFPEFYDKFRIIDVKEVKAEATKPKRVKAASSVKKVVRKGKAKTKKAAKKKGIK